MTIEELKHLEAIVIATDAREQALMLSEDEEYAEQVFDEVLFQCEMNV